MLRENKLTVLIPSYNGEKTLGKTLESLINQSFKELVIHIIDDGSTDDTRELVNKYQKAFPGIVEYYHKENGGIANARNFALDTVKTPYFAFLDSDDYVELNMYEVMMNKIEQTNSNICFCGFVWEYPNNSKEVKDGPYQNEKEILTNMFATLWNKVYDTDWIRSTGITFPDGLRYEDASFLYRLAPYMNSVSYVDHAFVHYIQRVGSITHTFNENIHDMMLVFQGIKDYYIENNIFEEYFSELEYLYIRFFLGNSYLRTSQIQEKEIRNELLEKSWGFLCSTFPNWKQNKYIKQVGKKNTYFRIINKRMFLLNSILINCLYRFKKNYK